MTIFILPQSCQIVGASEFPAGTENATFSVDSEDNVVITYGASKGSDNLWRYFATLPSVKPESTIGGKGQRITGLTAKGTFSSPFL